MYTYSVSGYDANNKVRFILSVSTVFFSLAKVQGSSL